jgi:hypothetical protein
LETGPERDEVAGECRKLRNEELHKWHSSPDIIRIIKSLRMTFPGREAQSLQRFGVKTEKKETTRKI